MGRLPPYVPVNFKKQEHGARVALKRHVCIAPQPVFGAPHARAAITQQGIKLKEQTVAVALAPQKAHERDEAGVRPKAQWQPYPCLLTRQELQAIIAEQLG